MSILHTLTLENLKRNKKRTIMTVLGVLLSTALICAVVGMVQSGIDSLTEYFKATSGDFHAYYHDVDKENIKYITENEKTERYSLSQDVGYASIEGGLNEIKPYYFVVEMTSEAIHDMAIHLQEGRLPEAPDEIVISNHLIYNAGLDLSVGDSLSLDVGQRVLPDGTVLGQDDVVFDLETGENLDESIVQTEHHDYTIVGIIERPDYTYEEFSAPGYTVISYMEGSSLRDEVNVAVTFTSARLAHNTIDQIDKTLGQAGDTNYTERSNDNLLNLEGDLSDAMLKTFFLLAAIILLIIVATSVFVIRNSFAISISEKKREYGMLASIGATSRQIRGSVLFEGAIMGLIGIPLGILLGYGAIFVLIRVLNLLISDMMGIHFVFHASLVVPVLSIVLGAVTIFLSCLIPAIKAGRITPIDAIRGNSEIEVKAKTLKVSPLTKRFFGIGGVIASKNLKRSRRKYRTTVVSLVLSISVFIALSSFVSYGRDSVATQFTDYSFNLLVSSEHPEGAEDEETIRTYQQILQQTGETDASYFHSIDAKTTVNESTEEPLILILTPETFGNYARSLNLAGDFSQMVILKDDVLIKNESGVREKINVYSVKPGDTMRVTIPVAGNEITKEMTVTARTEVAPMGIETYVYSGGYLIVSEDYFDARIRSVSELSSLYIQSEDPNQTESQIQTLKSSNPNWGNVQIYNMTTRANEERRMLMVIEIFLYGFITVITLIGVTNIFNTISTNMMLRRKEFAMLRSVGMTDREFRQMIRLENVLYSLKSLLIGIPLGLAGSFLLYGVMATQINLGYRIPVRPILISILFVFVIVGLTMIYSLRKIDEQSIIETIRNDTI